MIALFCLEPCYRVIYCCNSVACRGCLSSSREFVTARGRQAEDSSLTLFRALDLKLTGDWNETTRDQGVAAVARAYTSSSNTSARVYIYHMIPQQQAAIGRRERRKEQKYILSRSFACVRARVHHRARNINTRRSPCLLYSVLQLVVTCTSKYIINEVLA